MKLLFDIKTRRMMGIVDGPVTGLPPQLVVVTGKKPVQTETAYLNTDNTIGVKPLTMAERKLRIMPAVKNMPPPTTVEILAATAAIDTAAGNARLRYVTQSALQQQVYDIKAAEAAAYIAAGSPIDTTPYPLITAQAAGVGKTIKQIADSISATKTQWLTLAGTIEGIRLSGKAAAAAAATTTDALQTVATDTIAKLDAL